MTDAPDADGLFPVTRKWGFIALLFGVPVFLGALAIGYQDKGLILGASIVVIVMSSRVFWNFKNRTWFWVTGFLFSILHVSVTLMLNFSKPKVPIIIFLLPIMFGDFTVMVSAYWFAHKRLDARA